MSDVCPYCCTEFNDGRNKAIKCPHCKHEVCCVCSMKFFLSGQNEAACSHYECKKDFSVRFLTDNFPKTFVWHTYKDHRENMYLEQQLALMPETQLKFSGEIVIKSIEEKNKKLRTKIDILMKNVALLKQNAVVRKIDCKKKTIPYDDDDICKNIGRAILDKQVIEIKLEKNYNIIRKLERKQNQILNGDGDGDDIPDGLLYSDQDQVEKVSATPIIRCSCPKVGCNGFIMGKWTCGVCLTKICSKCREPKVHQHVCNPDILKSVQEISKTTKQCPGCKTSITKLDGCSQMFCTNPSCRIFFDWNSMKIIKNIILAHNIHFTEWLATLSVEERERVQNNKNGNVGNRDMCGIQITSFINLKLEPIIFNKVDQALRIMNEVRDNCSVNDDEQFEKSLLQYRKDYLYNKFPKDELKVLLHRHHKKYSKLNEAKQVRTMFYESSAYMMTKCLADIASKPDQKNKLCLTMLSKIEEICYLAQKNMNDIGIMYNSTEPRIMARRTNPDVLKILNTE